MTATLLMDRTVLASVPRDVVVMTGPDAADYLHGQLSADIAALEVGGSTLSFLLEPRGRIEAVFVISRTGADTYVADTEPGFGEPVAASLNRFKLRTRIEIDCGQWTMHALRSPRTVAEPDGSSTMAAWPAAVTAIGPEDAPEHVVRPAHWPLAAGQDVLSRPGSAPTQPSEAAEPVSAAEFEALRMAYGLPAMGTEIQPGDIPNETGVVERAASFTKGCYRGQELVERIDSRAGGRRTICRIRAEVPVSPGDELHGADGAAVGSVLSVASLAGVWVGFARTRRDAADEARTADGAPVVLAELF